ncbi:alpha/beta hydrolase [Flavimarina sp. Hel_I_48]|uniref:alpha/beta hydrolase n=1 Tax=Flavimarina sp. Hel_I_48 TaxID=1392488 RepID=UPI0004DFC62B|nr:alpha/beta fold hydrolase [Flavimarina sp. Hel_I_48]
MKEKQLSLTHIIQEPKSKTGDKSPLLLLLHGYGSNEQDLFSFASELPDNYFVISVRAPMPMQPYGNAWYTIYWDGSEAKRSDDVQAAEARDLVVQFIDEAVDAYDLDAKNVTLLGFSQGTIISYAVALTYPEKVKNLIGLSGYINEEITAPKEDHSVYYKLSVFSSHGSQDQVIPVEAARNTVMYLEKLGISSKLQEYPVGHGVAPQNLIDLKQWLQQQP